MALQAVWHSGASTLLCANVEFYAWLFGLYTGQLRVRERTRSMGEGKGKRVEVDTAKGVAIARTEC